MGLSTLILTAIAGGIDHLPDLAAHTGRDKRAVVKAAQVLKRRGLVVIIMANDFDRAFDAELPANRYALTEAGEAHATHGLPVNPGQGERPRRRTAGLRERAWWEIRNKKVASLKQIIGTHADGSERAPEINLYKYIAALEAAGIVKRLANKQPAKQSKGRVQWSLEKDLGLQAPVWRQKAQEVYDPNGDTVYSIKKEGE